MIQRLFFYLSMVFFSIHSMNEGNAFGPIFSNFDKETDEKCLEEIFKNDSRSLISKDYENGMGVKTFINYVKDPKINERKMMRINNNPVAFLIYFVLDKNKLNKNFYDGDLALTLMGVRPGERRQGNGSEVMHYFMKRSQELDAQKVWLSVKDGNIAAQKLYKKFGFVNTNVPSFSSTSHWWSAYIFSNEIINKRALYDTLLQQKNCDITIKYDKKYD